MIRKGLAAGGLRALRAVEAAAHQQAICQRERERERERVKEGSPPNHKPTADCAGTLGRTLSFLGGPQLHEQKSVEGDLPEAG